jgi:hypothetical protein
LLRCIRSRLALSGPAEMVCYLSAYGGEADISNRCARGNAASGQFGDIVTIWHMPLLLQSWGAPPTHVLRLSGTLPPLSASLVMTCFCSQTFIVAEPSRGPV